MMEFVEQEPEGLNLSLLDFQLILFGNRRGDNDYPSAKQSTIVRIGLDNRGRVQEPSAQRYCQATPKVSKLLPVRVLTPLLP